MTLAVGQVISNYEILGFIGAGAMGEVYRARDTQLDRSVAIKVLPENWARDPDQAPRFEREAKTLAALNHSNVAQIYGIDKADGASFLVLELVEGEDLATRIGRGPISAPDAIDICRQIAEGLEAAHEVGVVHRDLKPANIRVTPQGVVKVLDFGLAKSIRSGVDLEESGSLSSDGIWESEEGLLVGTPTYMSPEQVRGQQVDRRADIWGFGCVLYETLTGTRPFGGKILADVLAAVIEKAPDMSQLPAATPRRVRELLERCLDKNPRTRLQDIGEARIALDHDSGAALQSEAPARSRPGIPAVAILVTAILAALATFFVTRALQPRHAPATCLTGATFTKLTDFEGTEFGAAISRDGKFFAFISDRDGPLDAWVGRVGKDIFWNLTGGVRTGWWVKVREIDFNHDGSRIWLGGGLSRQLQDLPTTGGQLRNFWLPKSAEITWSPDGTQVVYHTSEEGDPLVVADASGVHHQPILTMEAGQHQHYPIWSLHGEWIYVVRGRPATLEMDLWRVRPTGRDPEQLTWNKRDVGYPAPLNSQTVLYVAREHNGAGPWLWQLDVETKVSRRVSTGVTQYTSVAASENGRRLVATVANPRARLWSVPILETELATESDAAPIADLRAIRGLAPRFGPAGLFFLSSRGTGDGLYHYRDGKVDEILKGPDVALLEPPAVSPSGDSLAILLRSEGRVRLHVISADGAVRRPLSDAAEVRGSPTWSPDGQWIAIGGSDSTGLGLFKFPVNGDPPQCIARGDALNPVWSPTSDLLLYLGAQLMGLHPLHAVRPSNGEEVEVPVIKITRLGERFRFMPDGKGLVYMQGSRPSQDFWLLDLATQKQRQLTQLEDSSSMRTFDIDPDGNRIVFGRLRPNSDILLIDLKGDDK